MGVTCYYDYDNEPNYPVYWRILMTGGRKIGIACMQSFDEYDYDQNRFLRGEDGQPIKFDTEESAILYLNENYKPEFIEDEYVTPNNQAFFRSAKRD
jgi:hypothetical protein